MLSSGEETALTILSVDFSSPLEREGMIDCASKWTAPLRLETF